MSNRTPVLFPDLDGSGRNRNRYAVERSIRALRAEARVQAYDAALLAAVRSTARALDAADKPYVVATVARVHLVGLQLLLGRPAPELDDAAYLRSLGIASVGDTSHS